MSKSTPTPGVLPLSLKRRPSFENLLPPNNNSLSRNLPARFIGESSYRSTLSFLLQIACFRVLPEYSLVIESSFGLSLLRRSYLCRLEHFETGAPINLTQQHIDAITKELQWIIRMELKIESVWLSQERLVEHLEQTNQFYTARLLTTLNQFQYIAMQLKVPTSGNAEKEKEKENGNTSDDTKKKKKNNHTESSSSGKDAKRESSSISIDIPAKSPPVAKIGLAAEVSSESKHEIYYTLQHRECLNNTKLCAFWKLFLLKPDEKEKMADEKSCDDTENDPCHYKNYFILAFPNKDEPKETISYPEATQAVQRLYQQGSHLGKILQLQCVGDINHAIQSGQGKELILLSEAYHDKQIVYIAKDVRKAYDNGAKIVLISGPSSSGKTTFASKLSLQLKLCGLQPVSLEVDMYYRNRDDPNHPKDRKGALNFEVIDAMRLEDLQKDIKKLLQGEEITEPYFDLKEGMQKPDQAKKKLSLKVENSILVMEGIFCLNPRLLGDIIVPHGEKPKSDTQCHAFRVFMCPIPFFNLDNLNFISEQIVRLIRRISRDNAHRGRNAEGTLLKWPMLQEGEEENMFRLIQNADVVFNSALAYEISVLNAYSKPLLQAVDFKSPQYKDANTLKSFCNSFLGMPDSDVPASSLLMEFIKTSIFASLGH